MSRTESARPGLDAFEVAGARLHLGVAGVGDLVDGLAAVDGLGDEALLFELREARVDRAGAGRVRPAGAVRERLHDVVAVAGALVEQVQQVEAQVAMGEDGGHDHSSSVPSVSAVPAVSAVSAVSDAATAARRSTVTSPETELARTSTKLPLSSPIEPV